MAMPIKYHKAILDYPIHIYTGRTDIPFINVIPGQLFKNLEIDVPTDPSYNTPILSDYISSGYIAPLDFTHDISGTVIPTPPTPPANALPSSLPGVPGAFFFLRA